MGDHCVNRLADELRAFDVRVARELREHLIAHLQEWEQAEALSTANEQRRRRFEALAAALAAPRAVAAA